ncbi:hypothetical protein [Streptomyces sp. NPDC059008]|uniref:hypothetical protein n=1 Tax=Streptomyces sp. NPDC059008 TaxID=3346693 RepID=UPI0036C61A01
MGIAITPILLNLKGRRDESDGSAYRAVRCGIVKLRMLVIRFDGLPSLVIQLQFAIPDS